MIFIVTGVFIALACYRMGFIIGKWAAKEEFDKIRQEMEMDTSDEVWNKLWHGD